jgi:aryl carrier-like protein
MGLSAPNPEAQARVIVSAWEKAGINPNHVGMIEAHGTGTKLGDPIEISGISKAFSTYTSDKQFCAVSALKSNIGHLDSAAGIAGVIKAVLQLYHGQLVKTLHFSAPNRKIDFIDSPVYVNTRLREWAARGPVRLCGVSSFGISGTNCHVVLEERPPREAISHADRTPTVLPISAKTEEALAALTERYASFLKTQADDALGDICYTAAVGRNHYKYRLAVSGASISEIRKKLENALGGAPRGCENDSEAAARHAQLAQRYMRGEDIDWETVLAAPGLRKTRLPLYPFKPSPCWLAIPDAADVIPRKPLPALRAEHVPAKVEFVGLNGREITDTEQYIGRIVAGLIGVETIDVNDNFYQLGVDSILALEIVREVAADRGVNVTAGDFMRHPNIAAFAGFLDAMNVKSTEKSAFKREIPSAEEREWYPLSSAQKRMYLASRMDDRSVHYNVSSAYILRGTLDIKRLEEAFAGLIDRHEVLRTAFHFVDGEVRQKIHDHVAFRLDVSEDEQRDVQKFVQDHIRPFSLDEESLLRVALGRAPDGAYILVCDMHHIICDGISSNILMHELAELYEKGETDQEVLQYRDFSQWQNTVFIQSARYQKQRAYWQSVYGAPPEQKEIPPDFARPQTICYDGSTLYRGVDAALKTALVQKAAGHGVTPYVYLFAVYTVLLRKYTGSYESVVGTAVSARTLKELERAVGMYVNTLAIRNTVSDSEPFQTLLERVNQSMLAAFDNQDYPFEKLLDTLNLPVQINRNPLFDTMFMMQSTRNTAIHMRGLDIECIDREEKYSQFDLRWNFYERDGSLRAEINYATHLFKPDTIERLWRDYIAILECTIENPGIAIEDINLDIGYKKMIYNPLPALF